MNNKQRNLQTGNHFNTNKTKQKNASTAKAEDRSNKINSKNFKENNKVNKNIEKVVVEKISADKLKTNNNSGSKDKYPRTTSFAQYNSKFKQQELRNVKKHCPSSPKTRNQYDFGKKSSGKKVSYRNNKPKVELNGKKQKRGESNVKTIKKSASNPELDLIKQNKLLKKIKEQLQIRNQTLQNEAENNSKQRHRKFEFRTQKYSRLLQQLKKQVKEEQESSKPSSIRSLKPKSLFKRRVSKLSREIQNFRSLSNQSEQVLHKMAKIKRKQEKQFKKEKEEYLQQIKKLEEQLREYRPNIGHLFTYTEYTNEKLVPESVIPQGCEQHSNIGIKLKYKSIQELQRQGQQIIKKYMTENTVQSADSQVTQLCLSILSNQSSQK